MNVRILCPDPRVPATLRCDWPVTVGDVIALEGLRLVVESRVFVAADAPEGCGVTVVEVRCEVM